MTSRKNTVQRLAAGLALALCLTTAAAQNYQVQLWSILPSTDPYLLAGSPTNQPLVVTYLGESTTLTTNNAVLMTLAQLNNCLATNAAAFAAAKVAAEITLSNHYQANFTGWQTIYALMPQGQTYFASQTNTLFTVLNSLAAGTNSAAQDHVRIVSLATAAYGAAIALRNISEYLDRLNPGLYNVYNRQADPGP